MIQITRLLFVFLSTFLLSLSASSQISVDTVYEEGRQKLFMVNLEVSGMKYVMKSQVPGDRYLKFYNLDHSLWKTINCNAMPTTEICGSPGLNYNFSSLYISETLFDCDDEIEFLYGSTTGCRWFSAVYKEDGSSLLVADSCLALVEAHIPHQWFPIYNTPEGTKLILSHLNGTAIVYDLPCSLAVSHNMIQESEINQFLSIYPNPSSAEVHINYSIPEGNDMAEIVVNNQAGEEVKRYNVDRTFSSLVLAPGELAAGTYVYSLVVAGEIIDAKKLIVY